MGVKNSNKSSKSTKPKKKPAPPAENLPVKQIAEFPIVLVEIRELAHRLEEKRVIQRDNPLDEITGADLEYVEITGKIKMLIDSCTQAIKLEGLAALVKRNGITSEEKGLIEEALNYYHDHCWSSLPVSKQQAVETMIALFEALQVVAPEPELVATVNPISNAKETMDQVFGEAAKMEVSAHHFVGLKELLEEGVGQWIGTQPPGEVRTCRLCGCTDDDCRQCFEKTGRPCHWVEPDLCSACVQTEGKTGYESSGVIAEG